MTTNIYAVYTTHEHIMQVLDHDDLKQCRPRMHEQFDMMQEFSVDAEPYRELHHLIAELTEALDEYA